MHAWMSGCVILLVHNGRMGKQLRSDLGRGIGSFSDVSMSSDAMDV